VDVTCNFDPLCPWTWMTSRWLLDAAEAEGFQVRFAPLSLAHLDRDNDDVPDHHRRLHELGRGLLRVVAHLEAAGDQPAIARLYDAYGDLVHRGGQEPTSAVVEQAIEAAGLDGAARAALDDESLDEQIGARTDAVVAAAGGDVGSPVLTWRGPDGEHAVFGPLINEVPDAAGTVDLWRATRTLAELGPFAELKLARGELQLSGS
jgi:hypothetical protein